MQKKIAAINDLSGYGRCSLMVAIPVISHMGIQCCPVPTSILSNHTGYPEYFFDDYTGKLPEYLVMWKKLNLKFDGIASGFLGSENQIDIVKEFIQNFSTEMTTVVIDPVMGDHGKLAPIYTEEMCRRMQKLVTMADIITPNMTEACRLTESIYRERGYTRAELLKMAEQLSKMGPSKVVITGINEGQYVGNFVYERGKGSTLIRNRRTGDERCGTGDLFASIIVCDAVNGIPFTVSVKKAADFVRRCMQRSVELAIDNKNGVCFEELLHTLRRGEKRE